MERDTEEAGPDTVRSNRNPEQDHETEGEGEGAKFSDEELRSTFWVM